MIQTTGMECFIDANLICHFRWPPRAHTKNAWKPFNFELWRNCLQRYHNSIGFALGVYPSKWFVSTTFLLARHKWVKWKSACMWKGIIGSFSPHRLISRYNVIDKFELVLQWVTAEEIVQGHSNAANGSNNNTGNHNGYNVNDLQQFIL